MTGFAPHNFLIQSTFTARKIFGEHAAEGKLPYLQ